MGIRRLRSTAITALAALALVLGVAGGPLWIPVVLAALALVAVLTVRRRQLFATGTGVLGTYVPARAVAASAVVVCLERADHDATSTLTALAAAAALVTLLFETPLGRTWRGGTRPVHHLPGISLDRPYSTHGGLLLAAGTFVLLLADAGVYVPVAGLVALGVAVVVGVVATVWTVDATRRKPTLRDAIAAALESYDAPVMLYLTGPAGTEYQFAVWVRQFEALGLRAVAVVRETVLARKVAAITTLPVVGAATLADLEAVQVPAFRVALYVNNGTKNTHNIRYGELTHVQLLHGDSDKPSSFNPVTAMFDKIFVAGQAGIERYRDHGIPIPRDKFEIVGRPQVADIELAGFRQDEHPFTVLYGPTWSGFNADNNFGSLHVGADIASRLVRRGWTVIFRPHPFSLREPASREHIAAIEEVLREDAAASGRRHVYGEEASATMTLVDCFNASDALVSDVSSVPADYLYSEKPFVIVQVDDAPLEEFLAEFALGRAAYVARAVEPATLETALDGLSDDTMVETRRAMRTFYLGDIPRETYAEAFPAAVRALVEANPAPAHPRERLDQGEEPTDAQEDADAEDD